MDGPNNRWSFSLYISDHTPRSIAAFVNLKRLCERHLPGQYTIKVVDITAHPEKARSACIVAIPTLIRTWPLPVRVCIGDLSDLERVLSGLELRAS
jgi:circadian clock protein KaiB